MAVITITELVQNPSGGDHFDVSFNINGGATQVETFHMVAIKDPTRNYTKEERRELMEFMIRHFCLAASATTKAQARAACLNKQIYV